MSVAKAEKFLLERFSQSQTVLFSLHLDLERPLPEADGIDCDGRSVLLAGAHALRQLPDGDAAVAMVLEEIRAGQLVEGVQAIGYAPAASEAMRTILWQPDVEEVLVDAERNTGKTQTILGTTVGMAELHARAGGPLPFQVLALHDSLTNAHAKTVPSVLEPHWHGLWSMQQANTVAVFTLGGMEMVKIFFVPADDQAGGERARAAAHMVWGEEVIASMHEGGISERIYDLARNSMQRLPTRRRVSVISTNPGSLESWPYQRFIDPGRPGAVRCRVPASDRLSPEQQRAQLESFRDVDLQRRLALGEWCGLQLGASCTPNFNPATHVARAPLRIEAFEEIWLGWDSGGSAHTHAVVVGQRVGMEVRIFAGLVSEDTGFEQHLAQRVLPWLSAHMPWVLNRVRGGPQRLLHRHDPAMEVADGGNIELNHLDRLRRALGGSLHPGPVSWGERIGPLLDLLNEGNGKGGMALQIDPGEATALLRRALNGEAYYAKTRGGQVSRDLQQKPNHPWEDLLDACCYFAGGVAPGLHRRARGPVHKPKVNCQYSVLGDDAPGRGGGR